MFKVVEGVRGVSHIQSDGRGVRPGVSHIQSDGRGVRGVSHVQGDVRGVSHVQGDGRR